MQDHKFVMALAVALLATGVTMSAAQADEDDRDERYGDKHSEEYSGERRGKPLQSTQFNAKFQQECATCHIAYPPRLLSAESWRKVISGLSKHFGSDASLNDKDTKEIADFLVNNASNRSAPTAPLRISETVWFKREHNSHEISPQVWNNPKVKSPANCAACHPQAERGDFNEHAIRMPR